MSPRKIQVAVVGLTDNGKSTFINTLLHGEYTETREEDCTKTVHVLNLKNPTTDTDTNPSNLCPTDPKVTLDKIKKLNKDEICDEANAVIPTIVLRKELVKLHHGLSLELHDFPGLDQESQYRDTLTNGNYDTVIVLVDALAAARKETRDKQEELLRFIAGSFDVQDPACPPLIIAINKVDKPSHNGKLRVQNMRQFIEDCFKAGCRTEIFSAVPIDEVSKQPEGTFPIVVTMSAMNAFPLRCAEVATSEKEIMSLGTDEVETLEKELLGSRSNDPAKNIFEVVRQNTTDGSRLQTALEDTGFPKMIAAIEKCIGGSQRQDFLISQQLIKEQEEAIRPLIQNDGPYTEELIANVTKQLQASPVIDAATNLSQFQSFIDAHLKLVAANFLQDPHSVDRMSKCFRQINLLEEEGAHLLCSKTEGSLQLDTIEKWTEGRKQKLLASQANVILDCVLRMVPSMDAAIPDPNRRSQKWESLTAEDWVINLDAILDKYSTFDTSFLQAKKTDMRNIVTALRNKQVTTATNTIGAELLDWTDLVDEYQQALETKKKKREEEAAAQRGEETLGVQITRFNSSLNDSLQELMETSNCQEAKMKTVIEAALETVIIREVKPMILQSVKQAVDAAFQSSAGHKRSHDELVEHSAPHPEILTIEDDSKTGTE